MVQLTHKIAIKKKISRQILMLSNGYESTKLTRRNLLNLIWLHGFLWPNNSDTHQVVKYERRLLLRQIHKSEIELNKQHGLYACFGY